MLQCSVGVRGCSAVDAVPFRVAAHAGAHSTADDDGNLFGADALHPGNAGQQRRSLALYQTRPRNSTLFLFFLNFQLNFCDIDVDSGNAGGPGQRQSAAQCGRRGLDTAATQSAHTAIGLGDHVQHHAAGRVGAQRPAQSEFPAPLRRSVRTLPAAHPLRRFRAQIFRGSCASSPP